MFLFFLDKELLVFLVAAVVTVSSLLICLTIVILRKRQPRLRRQISKLMSRFNVRKSPPSAVANIPVYSKVKKTSEKRNEIVDDI